MTEVVSRATARVRGLKRYFTGKPCKHGHVAQRNTVNGVCVPCGLIIDRRHHHANPGKRATKSKKWEAARAARRRAIKRNAGGLFSADEERRLRQKQKKCHICGKRFNKRDPATLDHVIALAVGGPHDASNIALAHRSCNELKQARRTHLI